MSFLSIFLKLTMADIRNALSMASRFDSTGLSHDAPTFFAEKDTFDRGSNIEEFVDLNYYRMESMDSGEDFYPYRELDFLHESPSFFYHPARG